MRSISRWLSPARAGGAGLILLAVWLRLRYLGYTEIWEDQALTLNIAMEWVRGGAFPLASMKSSFGVFNPPMAEYFFALPLFITPNLLGVVWLTALVNLGGIAALVWATAQVFGNRVAVWAGVLFVVNPWAVYYGRQIWLPSFTPGLAALTYACALLYFARAPRWRYVLIGALSFAATIQMHMTAGVLVGALVIMAACFPYQLRLKPLMVGAVLFGLMFVPFLMFHIQTRFADWEALRAGVGRPAEVNSASFLILLDMLQAKGIYSTIGTAAGQWRTWDVFGPGVDLIIAVILIGSAVGGLLIAGRHGRAVLARRPVPPAVVGHLLNVAWVAVPVLASVRHNLYLQNYYLLYVLPAALVMMAAGVNEVFERVRARWPRWAWLSFAPLAVIACQQFTLDIHGQNLLAAGASGKERVIDVQRAIETAQTLLAARPNCQLVVVSEGAKYESSRFALLRAFIQSAPVRFVQGRQAVLMPEPCALYFAAVDDTANLSLIAQPLPESTIRTPEQTWQFFDLPASARAKALARWPTETRLGEWQNGLELRQIEISGALLPGAALTVRDTWAVTQPAFPETVHFGHYVLAAGDAVVAQADGPGLESAQWQAGDLFQTQWTLQLPNDFAPEGAYTLGVAVYHYPNVENVLLADGAPLLRVPVFSNLP